MLFYMLLRGVVAFPLSLFISFFGTVRIRVTMYGRADDIDWH